MVPSTQSHICPSIICSGRSSASKGLFGGALAALASSTITEYCGGATGPLERWLLWLLRFAVVFCRNLSRPAPHYSAAQCCTVCLCRELEPARACAKQPRSTGVPPPIFFSLEMACCYCACSILANILVFFQISLYFAAV